MAAKWSVAWPGVVGTCLPGVGAWTWAPAVSLRPIINWKQLMCGRFVTLVITRVHNPVGKALRERVNSTAWNNRLLPCDHDHKDSSFSSFLRGPGFTRFVPLPLVARVLLAAFHFGPYAQNQHVSVPDGCATLELHPTATENCTARWPIHHAGTAQEANFYHQVPPVLQVAEAGKPTSQSIYTLYSATSARACSRQAEK